MSESGNGFDEREEDLRRAGAERHESEVGEGGVPHGDRVFFQPAFGIPEHDLFGFAGDDFNATVYVRAQVLLHEDIRGERDTHEEVEERARVSDELESARCHIECWQLHPAE